MADFNQLQDELKGALLKLGSSEWGAFRDAAAKDAEAFLNQSKADVERWAQMLQSKQLSEDEFKWLLQSKKDLAQMEALKLAGLSKEALDGFSNDLVNTLATVLPRWTAGKG